MLTSVSRFRGTFTLTLHIPSSPVCLGSVDKGCADWAKRRGDPSATPCRAWLMGSPLAVSLLFKLRFAHSVCWRVYRDFVAPSLRDAPTVCVLAGVSRSRGTLTS